MPQELLRVRCKQGHLVITETEIRVELTAFGSELRASSLWRSELTGIDRRMTVPSVFGLGGGGTLVFHGRGAERLQADMVQKKNMKKVMALLGR